jgi:hypothetical protein
MWPFSDPNQQRVSVGHALNPQRRNARGKAADGAISHACDHVGQLVVRAGCVVDAVLTAAGCPPLQRSDLFHDPRIVDEPDHFRI